MKCSSASRRFGRASLAGALALALSSAGLAVGFGAAVNTAPAGADTAPNDPSTPETVSAAALPTVQINGVVWAQVIVGNRVYATGQFSQARPAGAAAGTNQTPRSNIMAYDLTTGNLITTWAPTLNAQGLAIAASADGSTIYVGGDFSQVTGQSRTRIAAINATTGAVLPFNPRANSRVDAIALNGSTVYYGGDFTTGGNPTYVARGHLAAANATTGALLPWAPTTDRIVNSMVVHPASGRVIVGGSMNTINGITQLGMGSLDGVTGAVMPWAANTVIQNYGDGSAISALTTDGDKIFGTGWAYFGGGATANFEGVFSADPLTGELDWVDGGRGDNYGIATAGDVVYLAGHTHDWGMLGANPQYDPYNFQRAVAIDKHRSPTLTNAFGSPDIWQQFPGRPAAQPLHWLPTLTAGTYTGQGQAAWSVATNGNYVVLGGEFPKVNGIAQQGLVRFAKRGVSTATDPIQGYTELTPTATAQGPGSVRIGFTSAWDRDNARLTYQILRGGNANTATVVKQFQNDSTWYNRAPLGFVDTTAAPGSSQTYRIRVTDPWGLTLTSASVTTTIPSGAPQGSTYRSAVMADGPTNYWRLGETTDPIAYDRTGSNDLTLSAEAQRNQSGALLNESDAAVTYPGSMSSTTVQGVSPYWQSGPQTFSLESWVNTTTTSGGKIIGFGDRNTGRSSSNGVDRHVYMTNDGHLDFGVRPDMGARITVESPTSYNDGQWHHIVATLSSDGMKLYVDGNVVASNPAVTKAQVYRGYWRLGGDRTQSWPNAPTRDAINASIDEAAVYPTALTQAQVRAHFLASGRSLTNVPPVASFTSSNVDRTATVTSTSTDIDGTIVSYAWNFGDSTTGSGASTTHPYAAGGTYPVTLTVTDNNGGTNTITQNVTVTDPPPNVAPVADFTATNVNLNATLTSTSTDSDGSVVSYAWTFDDTTSGTGATVNHPYATANTYNVTLMVTDDDGATGTITKPVTVTAPPVNALPVASFTSSNIDRTATVVSTSTDSDGSIVSWAWAFGDTTTGTGATTSHLYAAAGTYPVTLTVTDNNGGTNTITQNVTVTDPAPINFALDPFTRVVANGFGTATVGGPWSLSGAAASFSVNGTVGRIAGVLSANRSAYLATVIQHDMDVTADVAIDRAATGGGVYVSVIGRRASAGNDYHVKLRYLPGGSVTAYLVRAVGNVETILATVPVSGITVAPGDVLRVRLQVSGAASTTVQAKVWRASAIEPAAWLATNTSAAPALLQGTGDVGVLLYTSGSWTGALPTLSLRNFRVGPIVP